MSAADVIAEHLWSVSARRLHSRTPVVLTALLWWRRRKADRESLACADGHHGDCFPQAARCTCTCHREVRDV